MMNNNENNLNSLINSFINATTQEEKGSSKDLLEEFGYDLVERARENKLEPIIGRDSEISAVLKTLSKKTKNNPILIGESGVGKTAIVEGVAERIARKEVSDSLINKKIYVLDYPLLLSYSMYKGQFEGMVRKIINLMIEKGNYIVFIDEIHVILSPQKMDNSIDMGNLLKPILARGILPFIGATTSTEYRKYIMPDPAFNRRFSTIFIKEMSIEDSIYLLKMTKEKMENFHNLTIEDQVISDAVYLSEFYRPMQYLPDKAIDLLDNTCSGISMKLHDINIFLAQDKKELARLESKRSEGNDPELKERIDQVAKSITKKSQIWNEYMEKKRKINEIQQKISKLEKDIIELESIFDYNSAAKLRYETIPELQKNINDLKNDAAKLNPQKNIVTRSDLKEAVAEYYSLDSKYIFANSEDVLEASQEWLKNLEKQPFFFEEMNEIVHFLTSKLITNMIDESSQNIGLLIHGNDAFDAEFIANEIAEMIFNTSINSFSVHSSGFKLYSLQKKQWEEEILSHVQEGNLFTPFFWSFDDLLNVYRNGFLLESLESLKDHNLINFFFVQNNEPEMMKKAFETNLFQKIFTCSEQNEENRIKFLQYIINKKLKEKGFYCSNTEEVLQNILIKFEDFNNKSIYHLTWQLIENNIALTKSKAVKYNPIFDTFDEINLELKSI